MSFSGPLRIAKNRETDNYEVITSDHDITTRKYDTKEEVIVWNDSHLICDG